MPIVRSGPQLIYYAHVPKCGGSAVQSYLHARFGPLAFEDRAYLSQPLARRWNRTSPQHVNLEALDRLFPSGFFDYSFAIVRHPVDRIVSAYHFQLEVERTIPRGTSLGDWLELVEHLRSEEPFAYDNHVRPMNEIVPEAARIFHLEHGMDALVPWLDAITGQKTGPRALLQLNERGAHGVAKGARVRPDSNDIARIAALYPDDFARFGYLPDARAPCSAAPELSPEVLAERDADLRSLRNRGRRLKSAIRSRLRRA